MAEERKEIELVDPLYEPVIMYPLKDLPMNEECFSKYNKEYRSGFKDHYQKIIRNIWKSMFLRFLREWGMDKKLAEYLQLENEQLEDVKNLLREIRIRRAERGGERDSWIEFVIKSIIEKIIENRKIKKHHGCIYPENCNKGLPDRYLSPSGKPYDYKKFTPDIAFKELYDLYNELINTFEMQRLMYLQMTGFLSFKYPSSTHTRFAHAVGTWISGLIALQNITVVTDKGEMRLIEFLANEDMHREFMAALILHDIGHAPFSHVLEMNPYLRYNHEKITEELIRGGEAYLILEDLLVSSYLDIEYGCDEKYGVVSKILDVAKYIRGSKEKFVLVHDVIESMGLNEDIIVELFSDNMSKDPAVNALKGLIHGVIDIDRIDHIYRDLHYNSFKTMGIPLTSLYRGIKIHYMDEKGKGPWIEISEEITPIIETLIAAREQSHKAIFDNPVNNFYIAVLNSAVSDAIIMFPLIKYYIPFLTDEALLHILINRDLFHNLSPTENVGIITGSSFGHLDYKYSTYRIRKWKWKNNRQIDKEMPSRRLKEDILKFVCELAERKNVIWYTFLKDVRKDYGLEPEMENYLEPEELEIGIYGKDGLSKWLLASIYLALGKEINEIEQVLKGEKKDDLKERLEEAIREKTGFESLEELYKKVKNGKEFEKKVKEIIEKVIEVVGKEEGKVEEAFKIFIKGLLTEVYIGEEKRSKNKLQKKMKDYIEGITWDGKEKRAWTFTLFAKSKDELSGIENELKNGVIWDRAGKRLIFNCLKNFNEEVKGSFRENVIAFLFFDDTKGESEKKEEIEKIRKCEEVLEDNLKDKREILIIEKIVDWEPVR